MLFEKLNKAERLLFDALGIGLVLFYSYSAVLEPAATQFHRGIYVVITYVLVFMLDDAIIFVIAIVTLTATGMTSRFLRVSHLVGGAVMVAIGGLLIFAPEWLIFAA